ncbi:MAG: hypothetical protein CL489_06140 [Acidobacteria bacterium]|nr:hypothetical protein [Acidobacteriota bacterium]|tara:strand:+ start:19113 stop:19460 length:348 start_codon:yes stop_codon:yes gene_type:complete
MARATLIPLGEYLNNVGGLSFSATRRPYYSKLEGGVQSIDLGIDYTEFEIDDDALDGTLKLIWNPHTIHYWVAGYYKGNATPGPELLDNAESVFEEAFQTRMDKRLPAALDELIK